jgi:hypothetical protein
MAMTTPTATYLKLADATIDGCIQGAVELHGERVGGVGGVSSDATNDCS